MEKRIRRLIVEVERRRVEWSASRSAPPPGAAGEQPAEPCQQCGATWLLLNHSALPEGKTSPPDLRALLASLRLHVQGTPAGNLWICRNSFEQLKENF